MAFSASNGTGTGKSRFRGVPTLSEMNVVPLVDVVLVLLIIFMITAQAMEFGLEIEVPKVRQEKASAEDLPVVSVTRSGEVYLADSPVNVNELAAVIKQKYRKSSAAYLRADKAASWNTAVQVIAKLGEAKIDVRVVTSADDDLPKKR